MKLRLTHLLFAIVVSSCASKETNNESDNAASLKNETENLGETTTQHNKSNDNKFWEPLVWNEYHDQNGVVIASMPFPSSWKVAKHPAKGDPGITGPNGLLIRDFPSQMYSYTNDPRMQQVYYQSGQQLRAMPGIDQLIQQDFVPWAENQGMQYVKHYEIPEVAKVDKWYSDQLYKAVPGRSEVAVVGTEWKKTDGSPYFLLIHINVSTTAELQNWFYYCTGLECGQAYFEKAKKQLVFALSNTHYPLEPIMAYNQSEAEKAGRSWEAHNRKMAQNQANFEAQQRAFVNKSNAINDAIMNGWRERNATSDIQQERTIDGIYERTNVVDPTSGQRYKVAAGANQYWMNSNGEYISSDQQNYDPNQDENMNRERWQELQEVK